MNRTHQLIEQLSNDPLVSGESLKKSYFFVLLCAGLVISSLGLAVFHIAGAPIRPGYLQVIGQPLIAVKQIVPLLIVITAAPLVALLARPEVRLSINTLPLTVALVILPVLAVSTLSPMTDDARIVAINGEGFVECLISIVGLSVGLIAAQILVLRRGAVTRPLSAGGIAGLAAGAIAAVAYAFICTEDSPGFFGLWYSIGILIAGALGALAGKFYLRW